MTNTTRCLISLLFILLGSGCSTYYYYPTYQAIPTNTKENEIRGSYFTSADNQGFNLNYSITKNLGAFLCVNTFNDYDFKKGAQIADLGLYFYKNQFFTENENIKMTYSISSAYGYGQNNRYHDFFDLDIHRIIIQPSFAIASRFVDFGISSRFSSVDYKLDRFVDERFDYYFIDLYDIGNHQFHFFEPHMYFGIGYKGLKLNYHIVNLSKINDPEILYYNNTVGYLSLGVKLDIDKIFYQ